MKRNRQPSADLNRVAARLCICLFFVMNLCVSQSESRGKMNDRAQKRMAVEVGHLGHWTAFQLNIITCIICDIPARGLERQEDERRRILLLIF